MSCKHIGYVQGCLSCAKRKWRNLYPILKEKNINKFNIKDGILDQIYNDLITIEEYNND